MKSEQFILALDQGTTSSRALLVNKAGEIVSVSQKEYKQIYPKPGWVEHDPMEIWSSQTAVEAEALAKADLRHHDIAAIGITNQRETTVVWDKKTGKPVYNAIVWQDRRTADYCATLKKESGLERKIGDKTGLRLDPYFSGTKLRWILENVEGVRERAEAGELLFGTIDSWLVWKFTGGEVHITDATNASRTLLYNIHEGDWDEELLALFNIPRIMLPEVKGCSEVYGHTTKNVPIAGIAGDQHAALFGQACFEPGMAKNTYGTGSVFMGGAVVQWLRDELELVRSAEECSELASQVPDAGGMYLVPAFAGLGAPHWDPYARGTCVGMTRGTNRKHYCRAALEAIAYQSADLAACMEKDAGFPIKELRVDGGASRSEPLMQFQSDLMRLDVIRPEIVETTALGAAYLAGLAVGFWKDKQDIIDQWKEEARFQPERKEAEMQSLAEGWTRAGMGTSRARIMKREDSLNHIKNAKEPYDFCIVGGGATGLGAAVDAASRGHSVVLVEQADFAKGTSSRSTKLVHGGVRYLQQGNVSLVLEALRERGRLTKNAPHLVHDLSFVIPNYSWWEGPFYGIGMKVYDRLAGKLGLGASKWLSKEETLERIPTVETKGLGGSVIYHDGQFDDSRLAVNLAQTAAGLGAKLANYLKCTGLQKSDGIVSGIEAEDIETGEKLPIQARCVINATGIFVDELRTKDEDSAKPMITVSQGIHLVLPKKFLPGNSAIMIPKTADGRVLFAVPWHDCVVVGTTDTPLSEKSLEPRALASEVEFVMEHAAKYLTKDPKPEDVLSIFAGLRPLVGAGDGSDTAAISRDHTIVVSNSGLVTVTGGKWTTYRKMAEDVIDQAEMVSGVDQKPCETATLQIQGWTRKEIPEPNLKPYGADAPAIRALGQDEKIHPLLTLTVAEVRWHARQEMARTVEDVLARRSRCLLLNAKASIEAAPAIAKILAEELAKDEAWISEQITAYEALARGYVFGDPASLGIE
eukprot:maker-scaffold6121_size4100-snap-gene-0.1 protein:Tk06863 transcript:maker-scaffold6121_size4100-snap-gene-0.1-mRNA-1 annotation:"fad-dependent oxidoreductase"